MGANMSVELPQVKDPVPVSNSAVVAAAEAILVESDSLNDWYNQEAAAGTLA